MQQHTENLSSHLNKFLGKKLSEVPAGDIKIIVEEIHNYLAVIADGKGDDEVKNILIHATFSRLNANILHIIVKYGDEILLEEMLKFIGAEAIEAKDINLFTPLHYAAFNGRVELVKMLLLYGADKNPKSAASTRGWTPTHFAAKNGYLEVVRTLLNAGVDKEFKAPFGLTILHIAAESGHTDLVKFLLDEKANKESKTDAENHKMTPLHYATLDNRREVISILLAHGADKNAKTLVGMDALQIAASAGYHDVAALLLKFGCSSLEEALEIAKKNNREEVVKEIEKYQLEIKNLFKNLEYFSSNLISAIKQFNRDNLCEEKLVLNDATSLNAHGILSVECEVGVLNKERKSLLQISEKKKMMDLADALKALARLY
jgi:ankyrin repeat protein